MTEHRRLDSDETGADMEADIGEPDAAADFKQEVGGVGIASGTYGLGLGSRAGGDEAATDLDGDVGLAGPR